MSAPMPLIPFEFYYRDDQLHAPYGGWPTSGENGTVSALRQKLKRLSYKECTAFLVRAAWGTNGVLLTITVRRPDVVHVGALTDITIARQVTADEASKMCDDDSALTDVIDAMLRDLEDHERQEAFCIDGVQVHNPHPVLVPQEAAPA